ncbi:MAG: ribosome assembly RNA-binding protein YhbY [Vicinamibacterales bacterium]
MALQLSAKERAHLKARAHALEPVVHIGSAGVTDNVMAEIERALTAHELIKVRAGAQERDERAGMLELITSRTGAAAVQTVGKVMVLWRPRPDEDRQG